MKVIILLYLLGVAHQNPNKPLVEGTFLSSEAPLEKAKPAKVEVQPQNI